MGECMFFISVFLKLLATAVSPKVSPPGPVWKEWVKSPRISPSSCRQRHPPTYRCFRKPLSTAAQQTSRTSQLCHWLSAAPCTRKIVQQQFRSLLAARSDDHPTILITQLKPAFFFRASGVQTKKNASFPKKNFTKTEVQKI